ncbi:MAG TPA: ABC transporter substrate-binding protein [Pseudomonas sp.]|nr:ABC transporter substrate-binding protein [Pseudomonas sp.]
MPRQLLRCLAVTACLLLPGMPAWAERGVSPSEVRVGMANAQSGPAAGLGFGMLVGAKAYFARVNAAGGVHGRKIRLISRDDGYEPARTAAQTEALIHTDQVFALLGYVGTPTSRAAMPIAMAAQVPYLFPFTGADFLRTPAKPWVFNIRASYFDETEELVERMTEDLGLSKIALLMQDDSFGESVKGGLAGALHQRGLQIQAEARILRNSLEVADAVHSLQLQQPEAIVFVGTYQQLAAAIKQAKATGMTARFLTVSFIGTDNFIAAAGADGDGVYITQVVPAPHDASVAVVGRYLHDVRPADIGYTSLEGYLGAMIFVQALRQAGAQPTRVKLTSALEALHSDLGGFKVAFSPTDHQGSDAVFLTRIQGGKAVPVDKMY